MAEDIVIDGEYVESAAKATLGMVAGGTYATFKELGKIDDLDYEAEGSLLESAGVGALLTGAYEVADEAAGYLGLEDTLQPNQYPEYCAGAALGHRSVQKAFDKLN